VAKKKDTFREVVDKVWPKTKKELEKGFASLKKTLSRSEKQLKELSDKGVKKTKEISLGLKKEKLYYDLGKAVASGTAIKSCKSTKIVAILKKIKDLDRKIKSIK
jgi:ERCC4-type nuclease